MNTHVTRILIACFFSLPSLAFAADKSTEVKPAPSAAVQTFRIGYVDVARIGDESERGKALKAHLTTKKDQLLEKIDVKKKQVEKLKASIEAKISTMTPKQQEAKSKEFQNKLEDFQKVARASEEEFLALQSKETASLYGAIERSSREYGKANNFAAIVVRKELLYIGSPENAQDVTDDIIKALNQSGQNK